VNDAALLSVEYSPANAQDVNVTGVDVVGALPLPNKDGTLHPELVTNVMSLHVCDVPHKQLVLT
jgi:hypothetical protein